jgi:regulator of sigma E protease
MFDILKIVYVVIVVVLMFGASIFVHEFGHFWMARRRGLKVEEFSIGFGPKIFGWVRDGVQYSWRWLPFGGYVKLPQMVTSETLEGDAKPEEELPPISAFSKILVAFAGPLMNVVFAYVIATLIFFTGLPVVVNPAVVGNVEPNTPEAATGIRRGDRIVSVDGRPVKYWEDAQIAACFARTNVVEVQVERSKESGKETVALHIPLQINTNFNVKMLQLDPMEHPVAKAVVPDMPAAKAGLSNQDEFVSFAGVPVQGIQQVMDMIHERSGVPTDLVVKRGEKRVTLTVTPTGEKGSKKGRIGVEFADGHTEIQHPSPQAQVTLVWNRTIDTLKALFHSKETGVGVGQVSGPPGIFAVLITNILTDLRLALSFLVLLNINLAVLNLFPIPVLDGGHILMALIETVMRRKLNPKLVEWVTNGCALVVISFILFVSFNDFKLRGGLFKNMITSSFHRGQAAKAANEPEKPVTIPDKPAGDAAGSPAPSSVPSPAPAK